ncbi:MAG TPA: anaerobic sulfite reductase subunit AsrA [Candidatus Ozemobacteraceae bacterium]|nr:anaerobic sulfite reductase subunit AsrA [Candidatus Ozemobacteraceae bacterium]
MEATTAPVRPASFLLSAAEFDTWLTRLSGTFELLGPTRRPGRGRFSATDVVRYGPITRSDEIVWDRKSDFSPKEAVFPPSETMLEFSGNETRLPAPPFDRPALVFLRACDVHGIDRLDAIFLVNGPWSDPYYLRRRERIRFVLLECLKPFENCFCKAMGTNRTDAWHAAVRREPDGSYNLAVRPDELRAALPETGRPTSYEPRGVETDAVAVRLPEPDRLEQAIREKDFFHHEMWEQYHTRCIACGRCNTSCVTCSCFAVQDVAFTEDERLGERRRVWTGCHLDRFADMAGGHRLREKHGDRMRFRTMHKIHDFKRRLGRSMCVGCGRCDDQCPQYISFSTCINRVTETITREMKP